MPRASVFVVTVLAVASAVAWTPAVSRVQEESANAAPIEPQLKADILHLLEMTHSIERAETGIRAAFQLMRPRLLVALPDTPNREKILSDYGDRLASLPQDPKFTDGLVAIYAKYFSDEDIKALLQFYATPVGQRFNQHSDNIAIDSMTFGQQFAAAHMSKVFAGICTDYPELRNTAKFCAVSEANKVQAPPRSK